MSLADGIWLTVSLVPWYLGAIIYSLTSGLREGAPIWFPAFGVVAILSGASSLWLAAKNKSPKAFWILLPIAASFVFVFVSGLFRGKLPHPGSVQTVATGIEVVLLFAMVWMLWPKWRMGAAFAVYSSTLWLFAVFMSSMAFTDTWL
jgi:hypothetical protein